MQNKKTIINDKKLNFQPTVCVMAVEIFRRVAHMRSIKKVSENSSPNDTSMERNSATSPRERNK